MNGSGSGSWGPHNSGERRRVSRENFFKKRELNTTEERTAKTIRGNKS